MRLIDVDVLIDKLQKEEEMVEADGYYCDNYKIIAELERTPTACAWIPVEDRLPDTEERVMCCTEAKNGNKNIVIGYYMDGAWRCGMNSNVIAWQPLPEPYKAGEQE